MDKWVPLAADKLHDKRSAAAVRKRVRTVGRLPEDALVAICQWLPVPDALALGRCCRRLRALSVDDRVWSRKLQWLSFKGLHLAVQAPGIKGRDDDAFGDFVTSDEVAPAAANGFVDGARRTPLTSRQTQLSGGSGRPSGVDDFIWAGGDEVDLSTSSPLGRQPAVQTESALPTDANALRTFKAQYLALCPFVRSLQTHSTSSLLFATPALTPVQRAQLIATLARFFRQALCCIQDQGTLSVIQRNLQSATDVFEGSLLSEFERFDDRKDEAGMHSVARVVWELGHGDASVVHTFVGKREIFYDTRFNPLENVVHNDGHAGHHGDGVDFNPLKRFMDHICSTIATEGSIIARVFPPEGSALLYFMDRLALDVLSEYVATLLSSAQTLQPPLFILTTAAAFTQMQRVVPAAEAIAPTGSRVTASQIRDIMCRIFEDNMGDYLQEEADWIKEVLGKVCGDARTTGHEPNFLAAENPVQAKRNVLSSFTKALLLPVTIVPKTVSYSLDAISYVGNEAFNTVAQLGPKFGAAQNADGYSSTKGSNVALETWLADDLATVELSAPDVGFAADETDDVLDDLSSESRKEAATTGGPEPADGGTGSLRLQTLLSLDVAVQLISADREALKRVQIFSAYPGAYGAKVQDTLEEIFIVLLQTLLQQHVSPAFERAVRRMRAFEAHGSDAAVAPLIEFFELAHVGDMVQQMVQAYFDKEMASSIDRTDFLNAVVREKKHFESSLDDAVAQGLNVGVDILMDQTEHILTSEQSPRDFTPEEDPVDLAPTRACRLAIECLSTHCGLLKGSTDKQIMEVFYQEVGIRLHTILCKHLKRCIVSISGGFQLIADLNAYYDFIVTFKQPHVTVYFTALKTVGSLFIITSAKDLGQLARDVHRFDGTLRSEDLYEFVQRRADWKRIEKAVDREIYGLGKEDCVVA